MARLRNILDIIFVFLYLRVIKKIDRVQSTTGYSDLQFLYFAARDGWGQGAIVEIGAYKGKSTVVLALGSKAKAREKIVSIDPHEEGVKEIYLRNLDLLGVADRVVPVSTTSEGARKKIQGPIRLLFIDGLHEYPNVAQDIALWKDLVTDGGILAFHDYNWPGVAKAVGELTKDPSYVIEGETGCSCLISKGRRMNAALFDKVRLFNGMKETLRSEFKKFVVLTGVFLMGIFSYLAYAQNHVSCWGPDFKIVSVLSAKDHNIQKIYAYQSTSLDPKPLVVSLHSWSGDYKQCTSSLAAQAKIRNWNYIHPDARGPNSNTKACGSDFVISDIDEAIDWALKNWRVDENRIYVVGASGGGYDALCLFMKSRHRINTFAAWCPITDLAAWYKESKARNNSYAGDILLCTASKNGSLDRAKALERSPLYWRTPVEKCQISKLKIYAGIHDGRSGAVPFTHAVRFYNKILSDLSVKDRSLYVSEDDVATMEKTGSFPGPRVEKIAGRTIFYKKQYGPIELVIFDGGHELLESAALDLD